MHVAAAMNCRMDTDGWTQIATLQAEWHKAWVTVWFRIMVLCVCIFVLFEKLMRKMKGENSRLKVELRLAKQTATRPECELDALAEKLEERECTVCLVRPARIAAVPCGHRWLCMSEECRAKVARHPVSRCPLCREPMTGTLRVF
jgi:hypothetical protein